MAGQLFVFSAPSGTGKSTILRSLRNSIGGLGYSVSHTSRRPRSGERNGVDYHFVDEATFRSMIDNGEFVEWARVYEDFYGTSYQSLRDQTVRGLDVLMDVDSQGAGNIKAGFDQCVLIYVLPPSLEVLEQRLRERKTDEEAVVKARLRKASREIKECRWYDYIIVNDDLETATEEAAAVVVAERCRTPRRLPEAASSFEGLIS